jgi:crotonobetainyl-CoA:carnitine CoA-transferase CaiB-like acyl-CoA transferase
MQSQGALAGIKVIDLSRLLPGPYCTMILADHGARVINIEDPRYEAEGLLVGTIMRNKEHMALNLKTPEGREVFWALAKDADVIVEGFRPGVVQRLGVDYANLRSLNPEIVYCSLSGFGQTGPLRNRAGHDVNYLSRAGVLDLMGYQDRPPAIPGIQVADMVGAMNGALGILLALYHRERTGRGQQIDIFLTDGMLAMMPVALLMQQLLGVLPERGNGMLSHGFACYNTYETRDGRFLAVGCVEFRFWEQLCRFLECPEFIPLQYDLSRREDIIQSLQAKFRTRTLQAWERDMEDLDICCSAVRRLDEALQDPLFIEREMIQHFPQSDAQPLTAIGTPVKMGATPGSLRTRPASFGAHTTDILRELGYTTSQMDDFATRGII